MYCNNCGKPCKSKHKFCSHCGFGIDSTMVAAATAAVVPSGSNNINTTTSSRTPAAYMEASGQRRTSNFAAKKKKNDKRNCDETTIYASMMRKDDEDNLKQEKGSRLPVKVKTDWGPYDLHKAVFEKFQRYNKYCEQKSKSDFKLIYKSGEVIKTIPGTDVPFTIKGYKEDLGVGYSSVIVYLLEYDSFSSSEDEDLNVVLPEALQTR